MYLRRRQKDRFLASNILLLFGPINYARPDTLRRIPESLVFGTLVTITIHHPCVNYYLSTSATRDRQTKAQMATTIR